MDHYHATGNCSRCGGHYGQHTPGCSREGIVPLCMVPLSERPDPDDFGF